MKWLIKILYRLRKTKLEWQTYRLEKEISYIEGWGYEGRGGRRVYLKSENLLVFNIEFCTAINIEVFVELNSGLSDFNPFSSISYFLDLLKLRKLGMRCSTWLNKIWRSQEYKKQSIR